MAGPRLRVVDAEGRAMPPLDPAQRPRTRQDCTGPRSVRPCPYVGCRHSLYGEIRADGSIRENFMDLDAFLDAPDTCSLDVAAKARRIGGLSEELVAPHIGHFRSRVGQLQEEAIAKLRANPDVTPELLVGMLSQDQDDPQEIPMTTEPTQTPVPKAQPAATAARRPRRRRPTGVRAIRDAPAALWASDDVRIVRGPGGRPVIECRAWLPLGSPAIPAERAVEVAKALARVVAERAA